MADTLIDVINDVHRELTKNPGKTAISDNDMTATIRLYINEALQNLYTLQPFEVDLDGTVTITPSTRTFSGPAGVELVNIHKWSLRINQTGGDIPLEWATEEYIMETFPGFETDESTMPSLVYYTSGLIGIYPLLKAGSANLTMQFKYSSQFTRLTATTATFPFKDDSTEMLFIRAFAQYRYEMLKALGQADATWIRARSYLDTLKARYAGMKRMGFVGPRFR